VRVSASVIARTTVAHARVELGLTAVGLDVVAVRVANGAGLQPALPTAASLVGVGEVAGRATGPTVGQGAQRSLAAVGLIVVAAGPQAAAARDAGSGSTSSQAVGILAL